MSAATAATAAPLNPLAGVAPALSALRGAAGASARTLLSVSGGVRQTAAALDRIKAGGDPAGAALKQFRSGADGTGKSLTRSGRSAGLSATRLRGGTGKAGGVAAALGPLASGAGLLDSLGGALGKGTGTVGRLMGPLSGALTVAAGAMTAVNVALRANPLGFVLGLVAPLIGYLVDLAVNSQTGQKIMKQVFDQALKAFKGVWTFLGPVVSAYGTLVAAQFKAVRTVVTTVVSVVGGTLVKGFNGARDAVSSATRALTGPVRAVWNAFRPVIQPILTWLTRKLPEKFQHVKDAMSRTLRGIGSFVSSGIQAVLGVVRGPLNAVISFANWVISGLNRLSFDFFGKKFGVSLPKIPQLADGAVVTPSASPAAAVLPLSALERLRPAEPGGREPARAPGRVVLAEYHEAEGAGVLGVVEDLLFLRRTAA